MKASGYIVLALSEGRILNATISIDSDEGIDVNGIPVPILSTPDDRSPDTYFVERLVSVITDLERLSVDDPDLAPGTFVISLPRS